MRLKEWCFRLGLRIPSSSLAGMTLSQLARITPEDITSEHCHDSQELSALEYVLSRILSDLDSDLPAETSNKTPGSPETTIETSLQPLVFQLPETEDDGPTEYAAPQQSNGSDPEITVQSLSERFTAICDFYRRNESNPTFSRELRTFLEPADLSIPYELLGFTIAEVLAYSFETHRNRWSENKRLITTVLLLERAASACRQTVSSLQELEDVQQSPWDYSESCEETRYKLDMAIWKKWRTQIYKHEAGDITIAQAADSLRNLKQYDFGKYPIRRFLDEDLHILDRYLYRTLPEYTALISAVSNVAHSLRDYKIGKLGTWQFAHHNLRPIQYWIYNLQESGEIPSVEEITVRIWRPLKWQLQNDLPPLWAAAAMMRLGPDPLRKDVTFVSAGEKLNLSSSRIQQIEASIARRIKQRWPTGVQILTELHRRLTTADAKMSAKALEQILARIFCEPVAAELAVSSSSEVLDAWTKAGRKRLTPMTDSRLTFWAATNFPMIRPETIRGWIREQSDTTVDSRGQTMYFSNDPVDKILSHIYSHTESMSLQQAAELSGLDAINLAARLERDPRFIYDENNTLATAEHRGLKRIEETWYLCLSDDIKLPMQLVVQMLVRGLSSRGIYDATAWGVWRFVGESVKNITGLDIDPGLTPVGLANALVQHSDGTITHMRRRRLRWDRSSEGSVARGKVGWVEHVVGLAGTPVVLEELPQLLADYYQDYARHVIQQLMSAADDEGGKSGRVQYISSTNRRIPPFIVPVDWTLNDECSNVSPETLKYARHLKNLLAVNDLHEDDFKQVPWLYEVIRCNQLVQSSAGDTVELEDIPTVDDAANPEEETPETEEFEVLTPVTLSTDTSDGSVSHEAKQNSANFVQKALPGLFGARSANELAQLHREGHSPDLFHACLSEPVVDLIPYAFWRITERAAELSRPWSLAELRLTPADTGWLGQLAARLSPEELTIFRKAENRFPQFSFDAQVGAVLLLQISEAGRRYASEGELWAPIARNVSWHPELTSFLFYRSRPNSRHRRMLEAAAAELDLRRAFGEDSVNEWYQSVFLQFGFSLRGIEQQLAGWLAGETTPTTIDRLRTDPRHRSDSFIQLWGVMAGYRQGTETSATLAAALKSSPWVLAEWQEIVARSCRTRSGSVVPPKTPDIDPAANEDTVEEQITGHFVDAVLLRTELLKEAIPRIAFCAEIPDLSDTDLVDDVYHLAIGDDQRLALIRQPDGKYKASVPELVLDPIAACLEANVKSQNGDVVYSQQIELWDPNEEITIYEVRHGRRIDPWDSRLPAADLLLIYSDDLRLDVANGPLQEGQLTSQFKYALLEKRFVGTSKLYLASEVLWEPAARQDDEWMRTIEVQPLYTPRHSPKRMTLRLLHSTRVELTAVRFRGRVYDCNPVRSGQTDCRSIELPDSILGVDYLHVTLLGRCENAVGRRRVRLSLRIEAHQWKGARGWEIIPAGFSADAADVRRMVFRFWLPDTTVPGQLWHVFEGWQWLAAAKRGGQELLELQGWGASLRLRTGPYNSCDSESVVIREIVDRGIISSVRTDSDGSVLIAIRTSIQRNSYHSIIVLSRNGSVTKIASSAIRDVETPIEDSPCFTWKIDRAELGFAAELIVALGIAYEGERLGSWWAEDWSDILCNANKQHSIDSTFESARVADALRWLHLPLLSERHLTAVREFAHAHAPEVLCSWLGSGGGGEFENNEMGESWNCVLRTVFADWIPTAAEALQIDRELEAREQSNEFVLQTSLWELNRISPFVAARFVQHWLRGYVQLYPKERPKIPQFLKLLKSKLIEAPGHSRDQHLNLLIESVARDVATGGAVAEGTYDFVREGLVEIAIRVFRERDSAEVLEQDRANINVAMRLPAFRALMLYHCLNVVEKLG